MKFINICFIIMLTAKVQICFAQNTLSGKITDKSSHVLSNVSIYIPDLKLGAVSNAAGTYTIKNIPNGTYLATATQVGYAAQTKEVIIKNTATANFVLTISGQELGEVIVTGFSTATKQKSNPIPVAVATHNELLQNSATNIIDAISILPGVNQITIGASISKPVIRGLGYNRVVTVNDGIRQEGQQWFDEFGEEVDEFSVDKVEILKGPASLSYGSDAMAGVINMLAAPPLPEGKIKGNILTNYQTNNGLIAGSLNLAGNEKGFIWDVRYSNKMAHDYKNKYDGYVVNSGYAESNFKALVGINRKWGYCRLTLSSFNTKLGIVEGIRDSTGQFLQHFVVEGPEDSLGLASAGSLTKYNNFPIIHQRIRHYKAVLDNSFIIGNGRLNLLLGFQQNNRQEANNPARGDVFNNYFFLNTLNYDVRYILQKKNHLELSVGINGMYQNSLNKGTAFVIPEYNIFDIGGFVLAKKQFDKLSITGGLRYDKRILKGKDLQVDSSGARLKGPEPGSLAAFTAYNSNFSALSGSVGITYEFDHNFYGKLNVARGYRAPTASESGANGIHDGTPFYEIGDHNLKEESSLQTDLTLGVNTNEITAEATGFVNKINNYIFAEKLASVFGGDSLREDPALALAEGPAFKYVQGNATLTGGEFVLNLHPSAFSRLHFDNSFSFVYARQNNQPDSTKYLPYTPPGKYRGELKFICPNSKTIKNAYLKLGIDYYLEQNKIYYKYGNETITPSYTLFNAGIGGDICSHNKTLFSVYIYGANLADVAYQSSMSRLKYADRNLATGRVGVFNMGRNITIKMIVPLQFGK